MGGLKKKLPITFITMLIGTIAIAGIPPLSGFFSKDEILAHAFASNKVLWIGGFIGALFTAFYMFRMLFLTFYGKFRGTYEEEKHVHESPASMTFPLIVLAVLSLIGGLINLPEVIGGNHGLATFLTPVFADSAAITGAFNLDHNTEYILMTVSGIAAIVMAIWAYRKYVTNAVVPEGDMMPKGFLEKLSYNKFYVDEIYDTLIVKPLDSLSVFFLSGCG